ncbi:GlxA family transcriptional regulator [Cohaesibacter haloalkalitolerans]|uniref:GlxA family transcriptional regulator n=1 Tax=Cohaesibacter haloalkalitolerans TaxID=1162980 RepID=UPI001968BED5|nr:DJ-1/PfpI family protein [Cohaesibacter haloalkalitolerans]
MLQMRRDMILLSNYATLLPLVTMHHFLIIVPDSSVLFEAAGIIDILSQAKAVLTSSDKEAVYSCEIASCDSHHIVRGRSGMAILADRCLADLSPESQYDTLLVTSRGLGSEQQDMVVDWLHQAAANAKRIISICGGAFLLAKAGLLDGRKATTHWQMLDKLQQEFPAVQVQRGPIYVQDGPVWTSAGVTAGFDLILAIIEQDCGTSIARQVAQKFVMYLRRPGGQLQFSEAITPSRKGNGLVSDLESWIVADLTRDLSVEALACRAAMSPRNFSRVFTREAGMSPARFVEEQRLALARLMLEQSAENLDVIAQKTGLGNGLNLRRVFERRLQLTPTEYRQRFGSVNLA